MKVQKIASKRILIVVVVAVVVDLHISHEFLWNVFISFVGGFFRAQRPAMNGKSTKPPACSKNARITYTHIFA